METRDSQNVQSATLSLPPRTIGVAGTAPVDALAFINLIQQNTAAMVKSPGAQSQASDPYSSADRPATQDRDNSVGEGDDSTAADSTDAQAKSIYDSADSGEDLQQPAIQESVDGKSVDDNPDDEEVIVGEAKVAVPIEDAKQANSEEGEATAIVDSTDKSAGASLAELAGDASQDNSAATDAAAEQVDATADFDQQLTEAAAEESSAAADSESLEDVAATKDKGDTAAETELVESPEGTKLVQEIIAEEQKQQNPADDDNDQSDKIRQAQEAAAAALEQSPVNDGLSAAEEFALNRREASERVHKVTEAKQKVDAQIDPTAAADPASAPPSVVASPPAASAAVAAAEIQVAPPAGPASPVAATSGAESSGVSAEPGLGSAIQRGLQRGLLQNATKSSGDAPPIDTAKQIQLIQRVSQAVRTAQTQGGPIKLRLSPPELGSLRVEMEVDEGGMKAKLEVESEAVRRVLLENLPHLRDRLAELNLRVDSFDVSVGQNGNPQDAGGTFAQQQQNSSNQQQSSSGRRGSTIAETPNVETTSAPVVNSNGQLNVMV